MNPFEELRPWFMIDEAAKRLSFDTGSKVSEADILRAALDGHLQLSANFPAETLATRLATNSVVTAANAEYIDGVWDVPMIGTGRRRIERWFHELRGLTPVPPEDWSSDSVVVERLGVRYELSGWVDLAPGV